MGNYLVIGASKGIGQALTNRLAKEGHHVFALARSKGEWHSRDLVTYIPFDVLSDRLDAVNFGETLDGLAYCPGSITLKPFRTIKRETLLEDLEINTLCAFELIQQAIPLFTPNAQSSIVLFSTVAVSTGMPFHTSVSISKGALEGMVRSLAAELAPQIRVNAVAPSITKTDLAHRFLNTDEKVNQSKERHPLKNIGQASQLSDTAYHLLVEATWTTGQVYHVDGGISTIKNL